jgi:hypothetical protein
MRSVLGAVLFFFVLYFPANSYGQRIQGVLIGGFNTTNVQGDDVFGFHKVGLNAGAAAFIPFGDNWSVSLETSYSEKGAYHAKGGRGMDYMLKHDYNEYKLVLNYVEVPILIHFEDKKFLKAGTGFSYGRLIEVKEWEDGVRMATTTLTDGPYDLNDFSWIFDIQIPIYQQLKFDARYSFSIFKIRERYYYNADETRKQYNQVLSFRVMWVFNEKISKRKGGKR